MNELYFRIMKLETKMEKNTNNSKIIKALVGGCILFSFGYSLTSNNISVKQDILTKLVWIIVMIVLVTSFFIDVYYIKKNKEYEFEIYESKIEDLKNKKRSAEIRGEVLPDFVLNKKIDMPKEEVALPIGYYSIMLVIGIIIRLKLIH